MARTNQGSLGRTGFFSFVYGVAGFVLVINHSPAEQVYEHDWLSYWIFAPLGAFCGFVIASCIHELGHFFAARLMGCHVRAMYIGSGTTLCKFNFMGTPCVVGESVRSGAVSFLLTSEQYARTKLFLIAGAAPAISILLAGGVVTLAWFNYPESSVGLTALGRFSFPFLVGMAMPCVFFLPGILIPYSYVYRGRRIESDAMVLFTIPWKKDADIQKQVQAAKALSELDVEIDTTVLSRDEAVANVTAHPNDPLALQTVIAFLRLSFDPRVPDYFRKLIAVAKEPAQRLAFIDQYLTYGLESNAIADNSSEMDALSAELLASDPNNPSLRGTRGGVLIDLGRREEGVAMLSDVLMRSEAAVDQSYSSIFMALAAKAGGDLETAKEYARHAQKADDECPALKRVADLLEPTAEHLS